MFVWCECCVLSGRGLSDEVITRPEESYRLWCVLVCDLETSRMRPWPTGGCRAKNKQTNKQATWWLLLCTAETCSYYQICYIKTCVSTDCTLTTGVLQVVQAQLDVTKNRGCNITDKALG